LFLRWKLLGGPLRSAQVSRAKGQLTSAAGLLAWLNDRSVGLAQCRQAHLDAWSADRIGDGEVDRAFLIWCMKTAQMPTLKIPVQARATSGTTPMHQSVRIDALQRLLTDESLSLRSRVAGSIVLLYAQPVSHIVRLTIDDVLCHEDEVALNLGEPPTPVPEPLAGLLQTYVKGRPNMTTAANPDCRWLFPGRRAGQPVHPDTLYELLKQIGVSAGSGRTSAIRQLVRQMPPPVVAQALGYHQVSAARIAAQAGSPWSGYAAGNHGQDRHSSTNNVAGQGIQTT